MPLLNLSSVTTTLQTLIYRRVTAGLIRLGQSGVHVVVSALPPDRLTGDHTIGLHLYHVTESAHMKNLPAATPDDPPLRFTPMGLELYYQLTAHSDFSDGEAAQAQTQMLFGLALKALRDYPVLDDGTVVEDPTNLPAIPPAPPPPVFPSELRNDGNRLRIGLEPLGAREALQYWTAGSQAPRLAAYYQVSTALLEPEPPKRHTGRVLRYGVHLFIRGAPYLEASRSTVTFQLSDELTARTLEARPAEASVGGQIVFFGTDLAGDETALLLRGPGLAEAIEVEAEWGVTATEDRAFATVQRRAGAEPIVPGFFTAAVKVTRRRRMPDGSMRAFVQSSNAVPFVVTPQMSTPAANAVAAADATGVVIVQGHLFQHPTFTRESIRVIVGSESLFLNDATHSLAAGEFEIVDGAAIAGVVLDDGTLPFIIRFRFPIAGLTPGDVLPLRVLVNGAENAPRFVRVP